MNKYVFECQNDNIRLSEELKTHVSKKFYKNIKSTNAKILVNDIEIPTYKEIKKGGGGHLEVLLFQKQS